MLHSPALPVPHGFSTRQDGDDPVPGGFRQVATVTQVHSADVVPVDASYDGADRAKADALVTAVPEIALAIVTADCAPVLLADAEAGVVAACHAGWRGAVGGILGNTVAEMAGLGARAGAIIAVIGPTIAQQSYEVDEAFRARFGASDDAFFAAGRTGRYQFDLPGFVREQLARAGVESVHDLSLDTYADPQRFHSYRRATHEKTATQGRQTSWIALPILT